MGRFAIGMPLYKYVNASKKDALGASKITRYRTRPYMYVSMVELIGTHGRAIEWAYPHVAFNSKLVIEKSPFQIAAKWFEFDTLPMVFYSYLLTNMVYLTVLE